MTNRLRRRPGAPRKPARQRRSVQLGTRIDPETADQLRALAAHHGVSQAEMLVTLIRRAHQAASATLAEVAQALAGE